MKILGKINACSKGTGCKFYIESGDKTVDNLKIFIKLKFSLFPSALLENLIFEL